MKTVQEIYDAYRIMPNLQLHQLRVAAVGKMICDNFCAKIETNNIVLACLFHDMGNIIKFNLSVFPEFLEPEGLQHWEKVREDFIGRYGTQHHVANHAIAEEIHLPQQVVAYIDRVDFSEIEHTRGSATIEVKICEYADLRVAPRGIVPMNERIQDMMVRYRDLFHNTESEDRSTQMLAAAQEIERELFECCSMKPENINNETVAPLVEELRNYLVA